MRIIELKLYIRKKKIEEVCHFGWGNDFLGTTPKVKSVEEQIDRFNSIKI